MPSSITNYHYTYIHNAFADLYDTFLSFINSVFNGRFRYSTVSTYSKFVRYIKDQAEYGREIDGVPYSAVVLNPSGDINLDETMGRLIWRFPQSGAFISKLLEPIYQDSNIKVHVGTSYVTGEMELIMIFDSIYEYLDARFLLLQLFRGMNQILTPLYVNTFIVLPDEVFLLNYNNEYTNESYTLDWLNNGAKNVLIKSLADNYNVFPLTFIPRFKLTGMSDGSKKYGGADELTEYRLVSTINFQTNIPSFLCVILDHAVEKIDFNIEISGIRRYTEFLPKDMPTIIKSFSSEYDNGLEPGVNGDFIITDDMTADVTKIDDYYFKIRYYHQITEQEAESDEIGIIIPELIDENTKLILISESNGELNYGDDYIIENNVIKLDNSQSKYHKNEVIKLYVYNKK